MAAIPQFPSYDPLGWQVEIAGWKIDPRAVLVEITRFPTGLRLDKKVAPGVNGSSLTFQGRNFAEAELLLTAGHMSPGYSHVDGWQILFGLSVLLFERGSDPVSLVHPVLASRGLTAAVCEEIDGPYMDKVTKEVTLKLKFTQYAPPPKKAAASSVTKEVDGGIFGAIKDVFSSSAAGKLTTKPAAYGPPTKPTAAAAKA